MVEDALAAVVEPLCLLEPPLFAIKMTATTITASRTMPRRAAARRPAGSSGARSGGWSPVQRLRAAPAGGGAGGHGLLVALWRRLPAPLGGCSGSGASASTGISGSGPLLSVPSSDATTRAHARSPGDSARFRRGLLGDHLGELAEQVVGDQRAALGRDPRPGTECVERRQGPFAHRRPVDREHLCDLVVTAPALQHELQDGALVGRQAVEGGHWEP